MWCTVNFKLLHQWIEVALAADGKGCLAYISFLDYRLFMQGQTPYAIAKYLTDKNIPTPTGKETWRHRTVKNILLSKSTKAMPACKSAIQWILRLPCGAWRNGGTVGGFQREAVPQACGLHNGLSGRQGGGSPSATAWRLAQRFERKQRAGSGDFRISCPLFLRVLFPYAPHISYYHSVSHVPDVHTDNRHGELVPACSLDKSIKSAIFKIVKKLTVR